MTKSKSTKKALLASCLSMLLCVAMLVGSTFAWFTDSVTTGVNKIQAGNLAIDLIHVKNGEDISIKENPNHLIFDYDKWEPGYTAVETLRVENKGNLALKFRLDALAAEATAGSAGEKLADVIDVYVFEGDDVSATTSFADMTEATGWRNAGSLTSLLADPDGMAYGVLLPTGAAPKNNEPVGSVQMTVALHMQENAGNAYQGLSLGDLSFTLNATQYTYEEDAFGDQYDAGAAYPIGSAAREQELIKNGYVAAESMDDLLGAIKSGTTVNVVLTDDIDLPKDTVSKIEYFAGVIDANGKTITTKSDTNGKATILGKGEIRNAVFKTENLWGFYTNGVSFYNCTFDGSNPYIELTSNVTVDNCKFINDTCLQFAYQEMKETQAKDVVVTVTNNIFNGCEKNSCLTFITYKESAQIWENENWSQYIIVKGNTFTPAAEQNEYEAIWLTDPAKKTILNNEQSFAGNNFFGGAKLVLNQDKTVTYSLQ